MRAFLRSHHPLNLNDGFKYLLNKIYMVVVGYYMLGGDVVPTVNLYLGEDEYVKLAYLALARRVKVTVLARTAVKEWLANQAEEPTPTNQPESKSS